MRNSKTKTRLAAGLVGIGGALSAFHIISAEWQIENLSAPILAILVVAAVVISLRPIDLVLTSETMGDGGESLAFAVGFAGLIGGGPLPGLIIHCASTLTAFRFGKSGRMFAALYSLGLAAVEVLAASHVFYLLTGNSWTLLTPMNLPAVLAAGFTMFAIHSVGVSAAVAFSLNISVSAAWKRCFLWMAPGYVGLTCVTALPMLSQPRMLSELALVSLPFAMVTYPSFRSFAEQARAGQVHIRQLERNQSQLGDLYLATIKSLALAIDAKDQYTHQHILRVQRYATAIAAHLGVTGDEMEAVRTGSLLHDIGKLGIPEHVLLKPGRLTDEEFAKVKKHPAIGAAILDPVEFPWPVLPIVKCHHEKWDGSGYPIGLRGNQIPLTARILSVADVYDALTSTRSYRDAWTHERAIQEIETSSGSHFDPAVVKAFLEVIPSVVAEMAAEGYGPLVGDGGASTRHLSPIAKQAVEDIRSASGELWALYEVTQSLTAGLGTKATLDILAPKLEALLPGSACIILLADDSSDCLSVQAAVGVNREYFVGCRTFNLLSASSVVARTRKPYVGPYDSDDLLLSSPTGADWVKLKSSLILPLIHQGQVLGTVNVYRPAADSFRSEDVRLLETIAERTSSALYNGVLYDRAQNSAFTDPLTGLFNVRYLTEKVEHRCERWRSRLAADPTATWRVEDQFALLCLDLDSFKPINDNFGHQKGDQVLRDLARIFKRTVREGDIVTRYGGDEFLVVLDGAESEAAKAMVERLQRAVESYDPGLRHPKLGSLHVGVSIGYACFPTDGQSCTSLLSAADAQMYSEKTERKLLRLVDVPAGARVESIDEGDDGDLSKAA